MKQTNQQPTCARGIQNVLFFRVVLTTICSLSVSVYCVREADAQDVKQPPVPRVERPKFSKSDWDGIFFENLFEQGLVGPRPESLTPNSASEIGGIENKTNSSATETGNLGWDRLITSSTIENEVKAIQTKLATDITTPVRFKSEYLKSHQSFSLLSMLFAVASQYEGQVRWKDDAKKAQATFWRAAANSRVGTIQAFESCKSRAEILAEMVRGGKMVNDETVPAELDWSQVVDRNPLMLRLQEALDRLKQATANQGEFTRRSSEVSHETELIAAIALVLTQENMSDAEDEGYQAFANHMQKFASEATHAVKENNFEKVASSINQLGQSCDACHADWR